MARAPAAADMVVYTDLDGTLLDHHDYSHAAAGPALDLLRRRGIPLVLTSSKTFPELAELAATLGFDSPVIGENGAFVAWPTTFDLPAEWDSEASGYRFRHFGRGHDEILDILQRLRREGGFRFVGFSDWRDDEVAAETGLDLAAAARAKQRQASEPIRWLGDDAELAAFRRALARQGLTLVRGGRFFHVMGQTSKGAALRWLHERLEQRAGRRLRAVALGDGPNDVDMLEAADIAVVVANPDSPPIAPRAERVVETTLPGPAGWNEAMLGLLQDENDNLDKQGKRA